VIDLGAVLQDLVELCQSPLGLGAPEVGRATLAVSQATTVLSRAATREATDTPDMRAHVREALARAHEALGAARQAVAKSRTARGRAAELTVASIRLRQPRASVTAVPAVLRAWTCVRQVMVPCPHCARSCEVRYRYGFSEGLVARDLPCPHPACDGHLTYHMPVNASAVSVFADDVARSRHRR
jgi:hypothetical protein